MFEFGLYLYDGLYYVSMNSGYCFEKKELETHLYEINLDTKKLTKNYKCLKTNDPYTFFKEICIPLGYVEISEFSNIRYFENVEKVKIS